jgi:hypothetical protein
MNGSTSISFYIYMLKVNNVILDFILRSIEFTIYLATPLDFNATSYCAHTNQTLVISLSDSLFYFILKTPLCK